MCCAFRGFALGVILTFATDFAVAEIANDRELYAAYCIGVLQEFRKSQLDTLQVVPDSVISRITREAQQNLDQKIARFRAYLAARGFLTQGRDLQAYTGIRVALQRGEIASRQCSEVIGRCVSSCPQRGDVGMKCVEKCRDEDATCTSTARCVHPDDLPI